MRERTRQVVAQTRARVLQGDPHYPPKVRPLFATHTEVVRQGKAGQPPEFGQGVRIQAAANPFLTDYHVCAERVPDPAWWGPSRARPPELFARPPELATVDAGFASVAHPRQAELRGVQRGALGRRGRRKDPLARARRWRPGWEGRSSALKRRHGRRGRPRGVGMAVIANHLRVLGRTAPAGKKPRLV
jgi:hypothetical protein